MLGYVPMKVKRFYIICCNSLDGLQFMKGYNTKQEARDELIKYRDEALKDPENKEVHYTSDTLHIVTNEWSDDIWYEIVQDEINV